MTKRLTIALIAVALFVVLAVLPAAAVTVNPNNFNGTQIDAGATIFIGEQGLNLTHALNQADSAYMSPPAGLNPHVMEYNTPLNLTIGWWASAALINQAGPDKTYPLGDYNYRDFRVTKEMFESYIGNWYLLQPGAAAAVIRPDGTASVVFSVQKPELSVAVWDYSQNGKDVTGMSVPQGEHLDVQVNTNMISALAAQRNNTRWLVAGNPIVGSQTSDLTPVLPGAVANSWKNRNFSSSDAANYTYVTANTTNAWILDVTWYQNMTNMTYLAPQTGAVPLLQTPYVNASSFCYRRGFWNTSATPPVSDTALADFQYSARNYSNRANGLQQRAAFDEACVPAEGVRFTPTNAATDGYITLKVKDEAGATYSSLIYGTQTGDQINPVVAQRFVRITRQLVNSQAWTPGTSADYWVTDALDVNNQYAYPVGTYMVWAESLLNNMKDNYKLAGADYTGRTISATGTVTFVSDSVKIEANKDTVVRSKSFSVTVTGKPQTPYYVWVKGTSGMDALYDNQPPLVVQGQERTFQDTAGGAVRIGSYQYENGGGGAVGGGGTIADDVCQPAATATVGRERFYAMINTTPAGTKTLEFATTNWTKAQKYTIRVEQHFPINVSSGYGATYTINGGDYYKSDEVDVSVEKGAVTIVAAGDQNYYLGEEIKFSGTNTETYQTFLFLIGPNLDENGAIITNQDPRNADVVDMNRNTFKVVDVNGDNTWSWKWGTANYALDAGTYTIYAVSQPRNKANLRDTAYGTVSIILKKPFVSATASQSTVARGDRLYITGTAEGDPNQVAIWVMGKNFAMRTTESVNSDSSFKYELRQATTTTMTSGQYFVVVQHPMQNKLFDVTLNLLTAANNPGYVVNDQLARAGAASGTTIFKLLGPSSLQGSDAAEALAQGINDANVDDTYTKLQFLVEEPKITIEPIGDKHVGDKFTISAQTNLAIDDEVLVQVYSSSFKPTQKSQSGEFSGTSDTIKVVKGEGGYNKLVFDVDASTFKPDEYIVTEQAVIQSTATANALFNVLETTVPVVTTAAPVVTTAAPVVTTAAPVVTTAAPIATPAKSPGFGALIALIGLGAVAFVVVRRH